MKSPESNVNTCRVRITIVTSPVAAILDIYVVNFQIAVSLHLYSNIGPIIIKTFIDNKRDLLFYFFALWIEPLRFAILSNWRADKWSKLGHFDERTLFM